MVQLKYPVLALFLTLLACKTTTQLSDLNWILGNWQVNESNNFENWTKVNDNLYQGTGYKIRKNDTLVMEIIELVEKEKEVFYIPTVKSQNDGKPIEFKLISKGPEQIIFENKGHDFPQRIIYNKAKNGLIEARIEGMKEGFFSEVKFTLKRVL